MKKYRLTNHGKTRANQRMQVSGKKDISSAFSSAVRYGLNPSDFTGPFNHFLKSKVRNKCHVKVHDGMIFIYKGRTMITCYEIPRKYMHYFLDRKLEKKLYLKWNDSKNKQLQKQVILRVRNVAHFVFNAKRYYVVADKKSFDIMYKYMLETESIIKVLFQHLFGEIPYPSNILMTEDLVHVMFKYNEMFRAYSLVTHGFGKKCVPEEKEMDKKNQKTMQHILLVLLSCLNYIRFNDYFINEYKGSDNNVKRFKNIKITK